MALRWHRDIAVLLLALALPLFALAHGPKDLPDDPKLLQQYKEGYAAYQQEDYATALKKWRPLAEQGSSAAQLFVGFMYANGQGLTRNDVEAAKWFGEAAERDNMVAQVRLAILYRDGRGVPADRVKALYLAKKAGRDQKDNHMRKIAQALQRSLEKAMTKKEIDAAVQRFAKGANTH